MYDAKLLSVKEPTYLESSALNPRLAQEIRHCFAHESSDPGSVCNGCGVKILAKIVVSFRYSRDYAEEVAPRFPLYLEPWTISVYYLTYSPNLRNFPVSGK